MLSCLLAEHASQMHDTRRSTSHRYAHCSNNRCGFDDWQEAISAASLEQVQMHACNADTAIGYPDNHSTMLARTSRNVQLPLLMRFSTFIAQTIGTFTMSVISCLPAVSACSSRSPSSQLDVTAETTTKRSLPHDFAPSPSRARKKVVSFLVRKSRFWSFRAKSFRLRRPDS